MTDFDFTQGFDIPAMHYKTHAINGRNYLYKEAVEQVETGRGATVKKLDNGLIEFAPPADNICTFYHSTNGDQNGRIESFLEKGILAGANRNVYAHQTPQPESYYRYTIEFEAEIDRDMYPRGYGNSATVSYMYPGFNAYTTDFTLYGVWVSGGKDIPANQILRVRDNETGQIIYKRD